MEILLAAVVAAAVAAIVVLAGQRRGPAAAGAARMPVVQATATAPPDARTAPNGSASVEGADVDEALASAPSAARSASGGAAATTPGELAGAGSPPGAGAALGSPGARTPAVAPGAGSALRSPGAASAASAPAGYDGAGPASANAPLASAAAPAGPEAPAFDSAAEAELTARRAEIARIEERLLAKQEAVDVRLSELERKERSLEDRARNLENQAERLKEAKQDQIRELERLSGLSASQARQLLLRELEDELRHDRAVLARQVEDEVRRDAERRARSILSTAMQRIASGHAAETTVSVVQLPSDELKGRIIGREGRNIRSLETLTGVDFIIDDTPSAVLLSGFDPVRREIALLTLERLIQDGRIHPARIEEAYEQAKEEIETHIAEVGEQAALDANTGQIHPELTKMLGRLHYRTSYGQNVLAHSIECANLAGMIAAELGASVKTARRAALLHDIGKAVSHEIEGPHALVGGQLARRYKESEAVAHAMEAHHGEVDMQTVEAVIVQIADALSGARPGARGESLEQYVKRLRDLEEIARRHDGVDKVYAMQAGREIRVIVQPEQVDDERAALISHQIARDVERELEYPGQIKVTVIRESRAVDFAK